MTFTPPSNKTVKLAVATCSVALLTSVSYAASIVVAAEQHNGLADAAGNLLAIGNQIRVGTFDAAGTDTALKAFADVGTYSAIALRFTQIGALHVGDTYGIPGYFSGEIQVPTNNDAFANAQVYLWVFKTSDNLDPNATYSNVVETAILWLDRSTPTAQNAFADAWRFRPQSAIPNSTAIDLANLTNASNNLSPGAHIAVGSFNRTADGGLGPARQFSTAAPVPEPTSIFFLGIGALSLIATRRRS